MALIKLNQEWSDLMEAYQADHRHPVNQACHAVGVPLIAGSLPVAATIVGIPVAAAMFAVGWGLNFLGHAVEGKKPSFVEDRRSLVVGFFWWTKKVGLPLVEMKPSALPQPPSAGASASRAA